VIDLLVAIIGPLLKVSPAPPPVPEGATGVTVFRASSRYLSYRYALTALSFLPIVVPVLLAVLVVFVLASKGKVPLWVLAFPGTYLLVLMGSAALALVSTRLDYEFHCYVNTDQSLRIRQGIWEQVEATLTYANVQNVRVIQGPLERFFGIASVAVDTAGGAKREGSAASTRGLIRGVEDAGALRDQIMARMRASKSSGLGDPDDHEGGHARGQELDVELLRAIRDEARGLAEDAAKRRAESAP
jgi:membrane protein YdbS with pleckstrin-like domain